MSRKGLRIPVFRPRPFLCPHTQHRPPEAPEGALPGLHWWVCPGCGHRSSYVMVKPGS